MITSQLFLAVKALFTQGHVTKNDVGLGNVDNTSDADKPVSDATQLALAALASGIPTREQIQDIVGEMLTGGTYTGITPTYSDNAEGDGFIDLDTTPPVTLNALSLSANTYQTNAVSGAVIGTIQGKTTGSTLALSPDDGRFAIDGSNNLIVGVSPDTVAGTKNFSIIETLTGATNTPKTNALSVTAQEAVMPWLFATQTTKANSSADVAASTSQAREARHLLTISSDANATKLKLMFANWWLNIGAGGKEELTGNPVTVSAAIEIGSTVVQVTFGGSNTYEMSDGETLLSDEILPASFSLANFAASTDIYIRTRMTVSNVGDRIPRSSIYASEAPNSRRNKALGDASELLNTGLMTGGATGNVGGPIAVIAQFDAPTRSIMGITDSIGFGFMDAVAVNGNAGGYLSRATYNNGTQIPFANISQSGSSLARFTINGGERERTRQLYQYASHVWMAFGANDLFNPASPDTTVYDTFLANLKTERDLIVAAGAIPIVSTVAPRTVTTDLWATESGQSDQTNWVSDEINTLNAAIKANTADYPIVVDVNDYWGVSGLANKWVTNGTANYPTTDGTHPSVAMNTLAGNQATMIASLSKR